MKKTKTVPALPSRLSALPQSFPNWGRWRLHGDSVKIWQKNLKVEHTLRQGLKLKLLRGLNEDL